MSRTQYFTAASLDGFIADERDGLDWLADPDDPADTTYAEFIRNVGAIAMGSATYEWVRHELAKTGAPWPYAQPTWVFTSRPRDAIAGAELHFVQGDVRPVHAAMTAVAGEKNLWIVGGGELAGQFHDAGLLDDVFIQYALVTLGAGKSLLPRRIVGSFRLASVRPIGTTMVAVHLTVAR